MLATTWVQVIKAVLLMTATIVLSLFVLERVSFKEVGGTGGLRGARTGSAAAAVSTQVHP